MPRTHTYIAVDYEYACPLTLRTESCQSMRCQGNFFLFNNIERRTDRKSITLSNDMDEV